MKKLLIGILVLFLGLMAVVWIVSERVSPVMLELPEGGVVDE